MPEVEYRDEMGRKSARMVGKQELVIWPWILPDQLNSQAHRQQVMDYLVFHGRKNGLRRYRDGPRDAAPGTTNEMTMKPVDYAHEGAAIQVKNHDIFFIPGVHEYAAKLFEQDLRRWEFSNANVMQHVLVPLEEMWKALRAMKIAKANISGEDFWGVFPDFKSNRYRYSILVDSISKVVEDLSQPLWIDSIGDPLVISIGLDSPGLSNTQKASMGLVKTCLRSFENKGQPVIRSENWSFVTFNKVAVPFSRPPHPQGYAE